MKLALVAIIVVGIAALAFLFLSSRTKAATITIDGRVTYNIDIATSTVAKAKGLSGRESLSPDAGMLFTFNDMTTRHFWMQGMLIPLDVLWIREGKIIGLQANIPHPAANNGQIATFQSPEPADQVLEINAGDIAKHGFAVGQAVSIDKNDDSR